MFRKIQIDLGAAAFEFLRLLLSVTIWSCHALVAPAVRLCQGRPVEHPQEGALEPKFPNPNPESPNKFEMTEKEETDRHVMLNPESVTPNLFRHLFRAGLFQHPVCFFSALSRRTFHPCSQNEVFRRSLNKPSPPRPLNSSGFTLIELIAAIIIIGILAATLLPRINFGSISSQTSVAGAANMVRSDLRYTQECAMANRVSKSVAFTSGQNTYTFLATIPATSGLDPSGRLPSGVTTTSTVTFTFNSLGEPSTSSGAWTVSVSDGVTTLPITITQYTGEVSY